MYAYIKGTLEEKTNTFAFAPILLYDIAGMWQNARRT